MKTQTHLDNPFGDDLSHLWRECFLDCVEIGCGWSAVAFLRRQQVIQAAILEERGIGASVRVKLCDPRRRCLLCRLLILFAGTCCRLLIGCRIFHINVVFVLDIINHCFVAGQIHPDRCFHLLFLCFTPEINRKSNLSSVFLLSHFGVQVQDHFAIFSVHYQVQFKLEIVFSSHFCSLPISNHFFDNFCHFYFYFSFRFCTKKS